MGNALWLLLALPAWYFGAASQLAGAGMLSLIPATGTLCLIIGLVLMIKQKAWGSAWFLIPVFVSEIFVGAAGLFRGKLNDPSPVLLSFLVLQCVMLGYLVFRLKGGRLTAIVLSAFCLSFALEACFIASMSFSDSWL